MLGMHGGPHSEYMWSSCEASVNNPGCVNCANYQGENDRALANHNASMIDSVDGFSVDSQEWCEQYCKYGYDDGVYSYCMKAHLQVDYPRGFGSDRETGNSSSRSSHEDSVQPD